MKRLSFASLSILFSLNFLGAQDLEGVKTQVLLQQYKAAKPVIDKILTSEKAMKKAEPWALKVSVYAGLAGDSTVSKDEAANLLNEAITAFNKYKELDPKYTIIKDYANGPINLYSQSFKRGIEGFNTKNWDAALKNFSAAVDYSDFLIDSKIITIKMDTISILYAGASAQNLKDDTNAFKYFSRLADAKIAEKDYEFLYQYLANYYMTKKDDANVSKYIALGKELYPESKYFPAIEEEYANSKDEFYVNMRDGEELFTKLYPKDEKDAPQGDLTEMENKMVVAFNKAVEVKSEKAGIAYANIGNHFINKSVSVSKKINELNEAIQALNKTAKPDKSGKYPPAPKDSLAKKEMLFKEYDGYADQAIANYEKAAAAFVAKKNPLDNIEKQYYKNSVSYLIDLYAEKKNNTIKTKPTESAKYAAAEKKWNDTYSSLK